MADNNFRFDRDRDPLSRDSVFQSDPLAELARLIGQTDTYAEPEPRARREEERYAPPPPPVRPAPPQSYGTREHDYEQDTADARYFTPAAATFNGYREDEAYAEPPAPKAHAYAPAPAHESHGAGEPKYQDEPDDDYYVPDPAPRRRSGLLAVMAIFALAVVGTAGAFGYRAMFGGSVLPTLPPIIKAGNGPNKIMPAGNDAQANAASPQGTASSGSGENLVSREEQPVNMEPPKPAPRVISTIPISSGQGSAASTAQATIAPNSPWPPSPVAAQPPPSAAAPAPATPVQTEAKKVHTVIIRSDQVGAPDTAAAPAPAAAAPTPPPAARTPPRPQAPPKAAAAASAPPAAASNAPLLIVPGSEAAAAPARTRVAAAPTPVTSGAAATASSSGGYAVQVTSQRSEAEAQASFRELQAKYPNQLSGREPIIRRADLGAKGTYYRALVGPFASAEEAAGLCSGLKAAGGSCLVQKN